MQDPGAILTGGQTVGVRRAHSGQGSWVLRVTVLTGLDPDNGAGRMGQE